jgi:hypothetical protein
MSFALLAVLYVALPELATAALPNDGKAPSFLFILGDECVQLRVPNPSPA